MRYEGRVFRPPSEAYSLIVQSTIGCSHNKCTFCDMYKEKKFRVRPLHEVLEDFDLARRAYRHIDRIFLADGDALVRKSSDWIKILEHIKRVIPECERVTSYASPKSILAKTPSELETLHKLGLEMVYMGVESGSDTILTKINKGETRDEIIRAGKMIMDSGIKLSVTAISGLGGTDMWEEHAVETGKAFSEIKPHYIGLLTLMFEGDTPLYRDMIDAIEHDREPVCSGIEGRKALELVLGIYESAATGKPVRFPLSRGSTMDYVGRFDR